MGPAPGSKPGSKPGRSRKKQKRLSESGENSLEVLARPRDILSELQHRNPKTYRFCCQTLGRRTKKRTERCGDHSTLLSHPVAQFPTDWSGDLPPDYYESFPYRPALPEIVTPLRRAGELDPLTRCMHVKSNWKLALDNLKKRASKNGLEQKFERINDEVISCPEIFVMIAAHLRNDPDPHFDDTYNWYYTGRGNIHRVKMFDCWHLVHSELNMLYVTRLVDDEIHADFDKSNKYVCGENKLILETVTLPEHSLIALRTKKTVYVLKVIQCEESLKFEKIKTFHTETIAFTSIEFDTNHPYPILYVTSLDNQLYILNVHTLQIKSISLGDSDELLNNWCSVQSCDKTHYVHTTKNGLHVYDKRTHTKSFSITNYKDVCDNCNIVTVSRKCEKLQAGFYLGTSHHLFCIDIRSSNALKPQILTKWTHGMQCPPTYVSTVDYELGNELICLSSQWPQDTTLIVNDTSHLKAGLPPDCVVMPYRPPSIFETVNKAREKNLCIDLHYDIVRRVGTTLTGCVVIECSEVFDILTQNSLGDIFKQSLYPEHLAYHRDNINLEKLHGWGEGLRVDKEFAVREIWDISRIWNGLQKAPSNVKFLNEPAVTNEHRSENDIVELLNDDNFDAGLLTAWDMDPEEDSKVFGLVT